MRTALESHVIEHETVLGEDGVDQMLALAERLRQANGGELDDSAIQAVAEATGAPVEYVRLAVKLRTEGQHRSFITHLRSQYLTLEPSVRRYVVAGFAAALCSFFFVLSEWAALRAHLRDATVSDAASPSGIFGIISLLWLTLGLYNACVCRDRRIGAAAGAIFGGGWALSNEIFRYTFGIHSDSPLLFVLFTLVGAISGLVLQTLTSRHRDRLGLRDPIRERQELLRQLVDLQDKLKSSEQSCTFLSVDIVGSTRMKELADPLSVEFTFNEYHRYVERIAVKHGGRVHSTAGDGVICAFDAAPTAFAAARNIQMGLLELNSFRNKIGAPIRIRQGIHTGTIMTAEAGDIKSVNFAHVIDVTAHLQKDAPIGGIAVSDAAAMYLPGGRESIGFERITSASVAATVWSPRAIGAIEVAATPPIPEANG